MSPGSPPVDLNAADPPTATASSVTAASASGVTTATLLLPSKEDRTRKFWTAEEDELLKEMVIEKNPRTPDEWEEIAHIMGRTVKSIKHKYNDKKYYELVNQTR